MTVSISRPYLGNIGLEVGDGEEVLQLGELLVRDLPLPLELAPPLLNHGPQAGVRVHELPNSARRPQNYIFFLL